MRLSYLWNPCGDQACWFCKGLKVYYIIQGIMLVLLLAVAVWERL